ncbi:MAG: hypothetical protein A2X94_07970 [Bdellovibrionales bacterium GWB1_55_8]|nr:MAG: hypothetical protein A2X94_07970 [Bdellovibrionales bacterium GWB1_55_8]
MENEIRISFAGVGIRFSSECCDLIVRLSSDFAGFPRMSPEDAPEFHIKSELLKPSLGTMPFGKRRKSRNCTISDSGSIRWNDYAGEAWVKYDFSSDSAEVYSERLERLHEITYLVALSRAGKALDGHGKHRIHAMAVASDDRVLVLSMPMKGGKTTAFLRLLDQDETLLTLSDDSPLVSCGGSVSAFPLRIGLDPESVTRHSHMGWIDWSKGYLLNRMRFGTKVLIPVPALNRGRFNGISRGTVLVRGIRVNAAEARVKRAGIWALFATVVRNLVIGDGLPMMREYFIENRKGDFVRCSLILFSRIRAALALLWRSEKYTAYLGTDHAANARELQKLLKGDRD